MSSSSHDIAEKDIEWAVSLARKLDMPLDSAVGHVLGHLQAIHQVRTLGEVGQMIAESLRGER